MVRSCPQTDRKASTKRRPSSKTRQSPRRARGPGQTRARPAAARGRGAGFERERAGFEHGGRGFRRVRFRGQKYRFRGPTCRRALQRRRCAAAAVARGAATDAGRCGVRRKGVNSPPRRQKCVYLQREHVHSRRRRAAARLRRRGRPRARAKALRREAAQAFGQGPQGRFDEGRSDGAAKAARVARGACEFPNSDAPVRLPTAAPRRRRRRRHGRFRGAAVAKRKRSCFFRRRVHTRVPRVWPPRSHLRRRRQRQCLRIVGPPASLAERRRRRVFDRRRRQHKERVARLLKGRLVETGEAGPRRVCPAGG
mmetsp:Transcript_25848/g.92180  ORF Transcript_25848/g.92180 Transcript_25848/m.92180 type:complete len:310 (+) Transcript_25848:773-1702(+)